MEKSDSNLSTPFEPPKPKKKRGRPPGSHSKPHLHKKQKAATSPPPTFGNGRPLLDAHSEPLNLHTRLLQSLVDVFRKLVAVLESLNKNDNADQEDGMTAPTGVPDYLGRAHQRPQSLGAHGPDPIDLTSSNEDHFPQPILDEVGGPSSAKRATSEEAKKTTQLFEKMVRELMSTTANPTGEKEKESVAGVDEGREAVYKAYGENLYTRAALQALDEARVRSSLRRADEPKVAGKDVLTGKRYKLPAHVRWLTDTVSGRFATPKHIASRDI